MWNYFTLMFNSVSSDTDFDFATMDQW